MRPSLSLLGEYLLTPVQSAKDARTHVQLCIYTVCMDTYAAVRVCVRMLQRGCRNGSWESIIIIFGRFFKSTKFIKREFFKYSLFDSPQRREGGKWIWPLPVSNGTDWHDNVDLPLCFQDTAVLYSILTVFWLLAAIKFLCGDTTKPAVPFSWLNIVKSVSRLFATCRVCDGGEH